MASKSDFSSDEWKSLTDAPLFAGMGVIKADFGLFSAAKEFAAIVKTIGHAKEQYPNSALIASVVDHWAETNTASMTDAGDEARDVEGLLGKVGAAVRIVDQKAPDDAADFKKFLFSVASVAAHAAGSGFFGSGDALSEKETSYLDKLNAALSSPQT
jgi:hypothetical protein